MPDGRRRDGPSGAYDARQIPAASPSVRRISPRLLALASVVCAVAVGVPALASAESSSTDFPDDFAASGPTNPEMLAAHEAEVAAQEAARQTPEAEAQRQNSKTAFEDESADDAVSLLKNKFDDELDELDADLARSFDASTVERFGSDFSATGNPPGPADRGVALSSLPLRDYSDDGRKEPVDLSLQRDGDVIEARNPLAELEIPSQLDHGVSLPQAEVGLRIQEGDASSPQARIIDGDKAWYFEVDSDTDVLIAPIALGVETFHILRSVHAPERFGFSLDLPSAASLQPDAEGDTQITGPDGQRLATIVEPAATDAQGADVPVQLEITARGFDLVIGHRDTDPAYPILLDPAVVIEDHWWNGGDQTFTGWSSSSTDTYSLRTSCLTSPSWLATAACTASHYGLYAYAVSGNTYSRGTYGQWNYTVPGPTGYIAEVDWDAVKWGRGNQTWTTPHGYMGLYSSANGWGPIKYYTGASTSNHSFSQYPSFPNQNRVLLGIGTSSAVSSKTMAPGDYRWLRAGYIRIWASDGDNPTVSVLSSPTGWTDGSQPLDVTVRGTDASLGVDMISIRRPQDSGMTVSAIWNPGCSGGASSPCPKTTATAGDPILTIPATSSYYTGLDTYPEGQTDAVVTAADPPGHLATTTVPIRIDQTPPEIVLSGPLAEGGVFSGGTYALTANASDGTSTDPRSGVALIEFLLDGNPVHAIDQVPDCGQDSCPLAGTYSLDMATLTETPHTLSVRATDYLGHTATRSVRILVDHGAAPFAYDLVYTYGGEFVLAANADGSNAWVVTPWGFQEPALSPDGNEAVMTNYGLSESNTKILVYSLIDGELKEQYNAPDGTHWGAPRFSPDGSKIIFGISGGAGGETWVLTRGNPTPQQVTNWGGGSPTFSADGTKIAFSSRTEPNGDPINGDPLGDNSAVFVADSNGANPVRLTPTDIVVVSKPKFSPSGQQLIFYGRQADGSSGLWSVNANGSGLQFLTGGGNPDWSPDGTNIVFTRGGTEPGIYQMNPDGSGITRIIDDVYANNPSYRQPSAFIGPDTTLLQEHLPIMRYDKFDSYYASNAAMLTDNYVPGERSNYLDAEDGTHIAAADPGLGYPVLSVDFLKSQLHPYIPGGPPALETDRIDAANNYQEDAQRLTAEGYADYVYGRVFRNSDGTILQYWFFYYNNPKTYLWVGNHEGDWEMVQVHLDQAATPIAATYAQHGGGERCDWINVQHAAGRPVVYVAEGSHASYFSDGYHLSADDTAGGQVGRSLRTLVNITPPSPEWVEWPGHWGGSREGWALESDSPRGPAFQGTKWSDPAAWSAEVGECTEGQIIP